NHEQILSSDFIAKASEAISSTKPDAVVQNMLHLLFKLVENGDETTRQQVQELVAAEKVEELTRHNNPGVASNAKKLLPHIVAPQLGGTGFEGKGA
ncbi:MAG: hypothetical protein EZS28_050138, partial [Streblomastix strix]